MAQVARVAKIIIGVCGSGDLHGAGNDLLGSRGSGGPCSLCSVCVCVCGPWTPHHAPQARTLLTHLLSHSLPHTRVEREWHGVSPGHLTTIV